jgi:DNA-binding NarL/FixJ family response regulator
MACDGLFGNRQATTETRGSQARRCRRATLIDSPRVVIGDAHTAARFGMRLALEADGFVIAGEALTARETVNITVVERPDASLLDLDLPGGGIVATKAICEAVPDTAVVILATSARKADLLSAIRAGASGYLLKSIDPLRLPVALRRALAGEAAIPRALVSRLVEEIRERGSRRQVPLRRDQRAGLTPREWQVLELISEELPTRKIAAQLGVSEVTVRRHVSELLRKLDVPDRTTLERRSRNEDRRAGRDSS